MLFYLFVLQDNEDSSSSLGDDDAGATAEEAATVVDEVTAPEVTAVKATVVAETADNVTAVAETADDVTTVAEAVEEEVIATEIAAERVVEEPEEVVGVVTAGITDGDRPTQGGSSKSGDHTDASLFDSSPLTRFYVRRARRGNVVSFDSERMLSASIALLTPHASQSESPPTAVDVLVRAPDVENTQEGGENTAA